MKAISSSSFLRGVWDFLFGCLCLFSLILTIPACSFVIGAVALAICWAVYGYPPIALVLMAVFAFALGYIYKIQSEEIETAGATRKQSRWDTPFSDLLLLILIGLLYILIVRMFQDNRLFVPFIAQIVLHVLGWFAKRFWHEPSNHAGEL